MNAFSDSLRSFQPVGFKRGLKNAEGETLRRYFVKMGVTQRVRTNVRDLRRGYIDSARRAQRKNLKSHEDQVGGAFISDDVRVLAPFIHEGSAG